MCLHAEGRLLTDNFLSLTICVFVSFVRTLSVYAAQSHFMQHSRVSMQHNHVSLQHSRVSFQHRCIFMQQSGISLQHNRISMQQRWPLPATVKLSYSIFALSPQQAFGLRPEQPANRHSYFKVQKACKGGSYYTGIRYNVRNLLQVEREGFGIRYIAVIKIGFTAYLRYFRYFVYAIEKMYTV